MMGPNRLTIGSQTRRKINMRRGRDGQPVNAKTDTPTDLRRERRKLSQDKAVNADAPAKEGREKGEQERGPLDERHREDQPEAEQGWWAGMDVVCEA